MRPLLFLALTILITAAAGAASAAAVGRRRRAFRRLAGEWGMRYVPLDVFNLAGRITPHFPVSGAAEVRVMDLIYGLEGNRHRCIFTAEYTVPEGAGHQRERCAMTVCEPQDASGPCAELTAAPEHLPLVEQYRELRRRA